MKKINIGEEVFEFDQNKIVSDYKLIKITENTISFSKGSKVIQGTYARHGKSLFIDLEGMTFEVSTGNRRKKTSAAAGDPTLLVAPMPGKVFKVLKTEGESVKAGDAVIVLEAMKMEHTIKALKDSIIKKIHFSEGDQVTSGSELVNLEIQE